LHVAATTLAIDARSCAGAQKQSYSFLVLFRQRPREALVSLATSRFCANFTYTHKVNILLAERMATIVETIQKAPAVDANDAQVIDIPVPANGEPEAQLSQTNSTNINGVPEDSGSEVPDTASNSDPAQMQKTIKALEMEVEQLKEKLK
jgi:hypothetical protein